MLVKLSVVYSMLHMMVIFFLVYEFRCSRRVFIAATSLVIGSLMGVVIWMIFRWGVAEAGRWGMMVGALPTLLYFLWMSKVRNARFVFLFCLADTIAIWVQLFSALIDYVAGGGGVVTVSLRLVLFPLMEYAIWRWGRSIFLEMLHTVRRGWVLFASMTGVCYILLSQISIYPTSLMERPEDMPVAFIVLALIALTYTTIFLVLYGQMSAFQAQERQRILETQVLMMERRVFEVQQMEDRLAIERHDLRHRLQTVAALAEQGDSAAVIEYVGTSQALLDETRRQRLCRNAVLDAVLSSYFEYARAQDIVVESRLSIPDELPVDAAELSTVFANALENAVHACGALPREKRRIICTCRPEPRFMFEVVNPYAGTIKFSRDGLPVSGKDGHGIGTRSIMAFAEKHRALCRFRAEKGWFKVQIAL